MNAEEAREISNKHKGLLEMKAQIELSRIMSEIRESAEIGLFSVWNYGGLQDETSKRLTEMGYKISKKGKIITISWLA